jgi:hypothetical protein
LPTVAALKESLDLTITRFIARTPEQARPARPQSGRNFQIHKVEATLVIIFKGLNINYRSDLTKISSSVPVIIKKSNLVIVRSRLALISMLSIILQLGP